MGLRRVLVIDDEQNILTSLRGVLEDEGFMVETAHKGTLGIARAKAFMPDVILLDIWMPKEDGVSVLASLKKQLPLVEVIMMSGHGTVETAVKTIKLGAFDFIEKPIDFDKLLVLLNHAFELKELRSENRFLKSELEEEILLGESPELKKLQDLLTVTAPSNGWVLIFGENGTGKELVARSLHRLSTRKDRFFVAVNCAAIPEERIESELFGHEKDAFAGATERKIGKLEQASGGTLFLDEVGDMSLKVQTTILRALEEGKIQRMGGQYPIEIDLRVVAATGQDLRKLIKKGEFREDLFYRLNVIPIVVPPLRKRKADIPVLVEHFVRRYSGGRPKTVSSSTLNFLRNYPWPGNVRELKNWVERACILSGAEIIESEPGMDILDLADKSLRSARSAFEKQFLLQMLAENGGNVSKTATTIGVEKAQLHKKMKNYGIEVPGNLNG